MVRLILRTPFGFLITGQFFSQIGDAFMRTALLVLVARQFGASPIGISLILVADLLPSIVLGPFAGVIADKVNRKWIMLLTDVARAATVLALFFTLPVHAFLLTFVLVLLLGFLTAFYGPAKSAAMPMVVGEDHIGDAMGASQTVSSSTQVIGMALGGLSAGIYGVSHSFLVDAGSFVLSALLTLPLPSLKPPAEDATTENGQHFSSGILGGLDAIRQAPVLQFLLAMFIPITLVLGIFNTAQSAILLQTFHLTSTFYGYNEAVFGIGSILGALLGTVLMRRVRPGSLLGGGVGALGVVFAAIIAVSFVANHMPHGIAMIVILAWSILLGVVVPIINVPLGSLFLKATPAPVRGRCAGLMQASINLSSLFGVMVGGALGSIVGNVVLIWAGGVALVIVVVVLPFARGFRTLQAKEEPSTVRESLGEAPKLVSPATLWTAPLMTQKLDDLRALDAFESPVAMAIIDACQDESKTTEDILRLVPNVDRETLQGWLAHLQAIHVLATSADNPPRYSAATEFNLSDDAVRSDPVSLEKWVVRYIDEGKRRFVEDIYRLASAEQVSDSDKALGIRVSVQKQGMTETEWQANGRRLDPVPADIREVAAAESEVSLTMQEQEHTFVEITMCYRLD